MNDIMDSDILTKQFGSPFVKSDFGLFISSTEVASIQTNGHIADDYDSYLTELEKCGDASATMPKSGVLTADPYPNRLRPVTDLSFLESARKVMIRSVRYYAYDTLKSGSSEQDATTNSAIIATASSSYGAFPLTRFSNGLIVDWQPNYFRPEILIKGQNIFKSYETNAFNIANKGDLSIGEHLPFEESVNYFINDKISKDEIEVRGAVGLNVPSANKIKRFALSCRIKFLYL